MSQETAPTTDKQREAYWADAIANAHARGLMIRLNDSPGFGYVHIHDAGGGWGIAQFSPERAARQLAEAHNRLVELVLTLADLHGVDIRNIQTKGQDGHPVQ